MKILVTGGGGFLGRYVVDKLLAQGHFVRILGRSDQPDLRARGVEVVLGDLAEPRVAGKAVGEMDVIHHLAAKAGVWGKWGDYFRANVTGTLNLLAACRDLGVKRLLYTSTPSVVFNRQPLSGVDESQPYGRDWLCHYPHTKMLAEREVLAANDPRGTGMRTIALRPHLIWGVGDNHLIPRVIDRARKGRLRMVGDGSNRVDIIHVENAASAQVLAQGALERDSCCGRAFFLSQGEPVLLWDWMNDLLRRVGINPVEKRISFKAAYRLGGVMEGIWSVLRLGGEPPMTRFVATELAKDHYFDISAAKKDLGYKPVVSTEAGLEELAKYWRERV